MVAAIEVDANRVPVAGGVIERINYDGDISGAVRDLRPRRRRHLRPRRQPRADRRSSATPATTPSRSARCSSRSATAATRTTASPRRTTSRPRRSRAASCRNGVSFEHGALRRHRQRQLHRLQQQGRAVPVRRRGRRHLHGARLRQGGPERSEGAVHQHQRRPGRGLHRLHGQRAGAHRRRRRLRHADRDRHRVRRRLRGQRQGRLRRRPVRHLRRPRAHRGRRASRATTASSSRAPARAWRSRSSAAWAATPSTSAAATARRSPWSATTSRATAASSSRPPPPTTRTYKNVFVRDVSVDVRDNDEAEVVVLLDLGPIRVFENGLGGIADGQQLHRSCSRRAPEENVSVNAVPVSLRESAQKAGGKGVAAGHAPTNRERRASETALALTFTRNNWFVPQTVYVFAGPGHARRGHQRLQHRAPHAAGGEPEGRRRLRRPRGARRGGDGRGRRCRVGADRLLQQPADGSLPEHLRADRCRGRHGSDPTAARRCNIDNYWVVLTKAPTGHVTVNFTLDGQIRRVDRRGARGR